MPNEPIAVIVDAYSAGRYLPDAFHRAGARVVHVQGAPAFLPTVPPPDLTPFEANVVHHGDLAGTVSALSEHRPTCVIPGQETGVELADALSERMGLPGNGYALSAARRDKYEMIEALRRAGVRCARQFKAGDAGELVKWADEDATYPYVVKPLRSASTDGVYICHTPDEVRVAAETVLAMRDIFDQANDEVLIQSYLDGVEYVVDTVSADGQRNLCGVWQYEKQMSGGKRIYDKEFLLAPDRTPVPELAAYVDSVLDTLGIRFGPAHAEVIMTAGGPALVEIGARLNGAINPEFHDVCLGSNQADLTAHAYLRSEEFACEHRGGTVYRMRHEALLYNATTALDGMVTRIDEDVVAAISTLPTVHSVLVKVPVGGRIRPTTDLISSPLRVFFVGDSMDDVLADQARVRQLKGDVYRVD